MAFLGAADILLFAHWMAALAAIQGRLPRVVAPLHLLVGLLGLAGATLSVLPSWQMKSHDYNTLAFFAFGAGSMGLIAWELRLPNAWTRGWRQALAVASIASGLFVMFTVVDHWRFFDAEGDRAGVANAALIGADDVQCPGGMVLMRIEANDAVYRCPESIVWGGYSAKPFAPWPSYSEGRSVQLKDKLAAALANARKME